MDYSSSFLYSLTDTDTGSALPYKHTIAYTMYGLMPINNSVTVIVDCSVPLTIKPKGAVYHISNHLFSWPWLFVRIRTNSLGDYSSVYGQIAHVCVYTICPNTDK